MFEETKEFLEQQYPAWNFKWESVGNQIRGFCPHHGDTHKPNLYIANKGNGEFFKCFACGFAGKTGYIKNNPQTKALYSPELLKVFKITNRLATYFADNLTNDALKNIDDELANKAKDYLDTRNPQLFSYIKDKILVGLLPRFLKTKFIIDHFGLTKDFEALSPEIQKQILSMDKYAGCMVFMYTDIHANVVMLKFRNFLKEDINRSNKQIFTLKFTDGAFNLSNIVDQDSEYKFVYIVEGEFDVLTPIAFFNNYNDEMMRELNDQYLPEVDITQEDLNKIVGAGSVDNIHRVATTLLANGYTPILLPDFDEAGQKGIVNVVKAVDAKALDNIFAVYRRPLNVKGKDLDEIFLTEDNHQFTFFNTIQPVSLREIQILLNKVQQDNIFNKVNELPANLQVPFLQSQGVKVHFKDSVIPNFFETIEIENDWLIKDILYKNIINIVAGLGGSGKTTLTIQFILHLLLNANLTNDITVKPISKVTIISAEETVPMIIDKITKLFKYFSIATGAKIDTLKQQLQGRIQLITQNNILTEQEFGKVVKTENFDTVKALVDIFNPDVVIIDSLSSTNIVKIQDGIGAQGVMRYIQELTEDRTCVLLHHLTKDTINADDITKIEADKILGSANLTNNARQVDLLYKQCLKVVKSNLLSLADINSYYYQLEEASDLDGKHIYGVNFIKTEIKQKEKTTASDTSNTSNKPTREELIAQIVKLKPDVDVKRLEQLTINQLIRILKELKNSNGGQK